MARERAKLNAILSIPSIPLVFFFVGNNADRRTYPRIKRMKGNPNSILSMLFIESNAIGSKRMPQSMQRIISIGYVLNDIFIEKRRIS